MFIYSNSPYSSPTLNPSISFLNLHHGVHTSSKLNPAGALPLLPWILLLPHLSSMKFANRHHYVCLLTCLQNLCLLCSFGIYC